MKLYKDFVPSVSIVLPTFNRAYVIKRAINSVIKQTVSDWELIIIDDGSNDNTFDICKSYIIKDFNIKYFKQSNRGLPSSLNEGIKVACGKFIAFLGSDDEYLPNHLELRLAFLEKNPTVELLHGGAKIIGDNYVKDKNNVSKKIHLSNCVIGGTFFGKKNLFKKLNGFKNISYSEDSDFFERAVKIGTEILKVEYPTYIYHRDTDDSICNTINSN